MTFEATLVVVMTTLALAGYGGYSGQAPINIIA
jgi:hypothetical protein